MNVLFINMPLRESALPNTTPQGILLLATNLRDNHGADCSVIDLNGYRIKDNTDLPNGRHLTKEEARNLIEAHINKHGEPAIVGLSGMITTLKWQQWTAKTIRSILPDTFIVSGNGLATELKEGLFNYMPELDAVATGEGDDIIVEIVYGDKAKYSVGTIGGIERYVYNGTSPADLDKVPFADLSFIEEDVFGYKMLEYYLGNAVWGSSANNSSATSFTMERSSTFISSRGCPHGCRYCFKGQTGGRNYSMRSAENVALEFKEHIEKYNVDFVGIPDDNFAINYQRILDLVPLLKPLGIRWGTHLRLDEAAGIKTRTNGEIIFEEPKRIDKLAEGGCIYIGFGAESASAKVLKSMGKGGFMLKNGMKEVEVEGKTYEFPISMMEGVKNSLYAGIHSNLTWILGYPSEELADLQTSVAFIKWQEEFYASHGIGTESVNKSMFTITFYPGVEMGNHPKVRRTLEDVFGLTFKGNTPICDKQYYNYLCELDDATKLLTNPSTGEPVNYSDMPMDTFLKCRELIDSGRTFEILDL